MTTFSFPRGRDFTVHDLATTPDDGNRYELIDGTLLVSSAPGISHQTAVGELAILLRQRCPTDLRVLLGPYGVRPSESTEVQPDVLVARNADFTEQFLPVGPLLAVEVRSPSSALVDLHLKKAVYQRMGTPSYWLVDPVEPSLTVFELDDARRYQLVAEVCDDKAFDAVRPFPVRVVPAELLR